MNVADSAALLGEGTRVAGMDLAARHASLLVSANLNHVQVDCGCCQLIVFL